MRKEGEDIYREQMGFLQPHSAPFKQALDAIPNLLGQEWGAVFGLARSSPSPFLQPNFDR